jgi:hypothetical protein
MSQQPTVDELVIADPPGAWWAAGFRIDGDLCQVGAVRLRLEGPGRGRGIVGWSVRGAVTLELDGLPTTASGRPPPAAAERHPNGVVSIDHLVLLTPDIDRTTTTLRDAAFDLRREREGPTPGGSRRQSLFRMGEVILEVVEAPAGTRIADDRTARPASGGSPSWSRSSSTPPQGWATCSANRARPCSPAGASRRFARRPASARRLRS